MEELSPEELNTITSRQMGKYTYSKEAFDRAAADLMNKPPPPPRFHLIILTGPFDSADTLRRIARLPKTPTIESTTTIPKKDGEMARKVSFCRVDDTGFCNIAEWGLEHGYCYLPRTPVVFENEKDRKALESYFDASRLEKGDEGFSDEDK
ncbi:MAG: hypothetical protein M1816_000363 [Peltula sp. TS41687]|nr:MAG: hypothetical protein M1816_000363 [Peltula sp. TS41687]